MDVRGRGVGRYVIAFVVLVLAGLVAWVISTPAAAVKLFGESGYEAAYSSPVYALFGLPLLALPPLVAGFLLPKGFFLWGLASVLMYGPGYVWMYLNAGPEVTFGTPDPGFGQVLGLAFVESTMFFFLVITCTGAAAIGAGVRALIWWRRGSLRQNLSGSGAGG